ncbi:MAG TPA: DUF4129 domain-containing protein [Streptosporangiaceae bacterium]
MGVNRGRALAMISGSQAGPGGWPGSGAEPGRGGQPGPGDGRPRSGSHMPGQPGEPGVLRFVLLALLIIVILTGLGGLAVAPGWTGHYHHDGVVIGGGLEVVLAALLVTVQVRGRRGEPGAFVAARLRTALSYLLTAALIAIPLILLGSVRLRGNASPRRHELQPTPKPRLASPPRPPHKLDIPLAAILYGLLALLLLAAVVVCVLRIRRRHAWLARQAPPGEFGGEPDELRGAVESGRAAMRYVDDTRAAIIACYLAMEHSLASAGTARGIADTPDELLAKAATAGLVRGGAAAGLTSLFYEARFSSHPMGQGQRYAAEQALNEIAAGLRGRRPAAAAADAPGTQP